MARTFGAVNSDRIDCGTSASLTDLAAGSYLFWVNPTNVATTPQKRFLQKGLLATGYHYMAPGDTASGDVILIVRRSTQDLLALSTGGAITTNAWQFVAGTFDANGTNTDQHIYVGTLSALATEVGGYTMQRVGSGSLVSNAGHDQFIGNDENLTHAMIGAMAWVGIWNRVLSLGEIRAQQFRPHVTSGCVLFLPLRGFATEVDLSGNGNHGTVTGTTISAHVPLPKPQRKLWAVQWQAAGGATVTGSANLAAATVVSATGRLTAIGSATLTALASLAVTARRTTFGVASIAATASESASGVVVKLGAASIAAQGTVSASGLVTKLGQATVSALTTVSASSGAVAGAASIAATATVNAAATVLTRGQVTLTALASVAGTARQTAFATSALAASASISTSGIVVRFGQAAVSAVATVSATVGATLGQAHLAATSAVNTSGRVTALGAASIASAATVGAMGMRRVFGTATLSATTTVVGAGRSIALAIAHLASTVSLAVQGFVGSAHPTVKQPSRVALGSMGQTVASVTSGRTSASLATTGRTRAEVT